MRPTTLDDLVGQDEALTPGGFLREAVASDRVPSLILWGPPGSGKTSLALVIAAHTKAVFEVFSAVLGGIKEVSLFPELQIPRSTARSWIRRGCPDVIELDGGVDRLAQLEARVGKLDSRIAMLHAVMRLLLLMLRLSGMHLDWTRVSEGAKKVAVLRTIEKATKAL